VEKLSLRQIAKTLKMGHRRVKRILEQQGLQIRSLPNLPLLEPFWHLIAHWYGEYPLLKAKQVYERLRAYSYRGSYATVARASRRYRTKKAQAYHPLQFLPGEEAQVDWFFFHHPRLGKLAGFLYVLAYSRYAWGVFYPRTAFEFFLAAHLECFRHLAGCARRHRYDNLKSVVLSRKSLNTTRNSWILQDSLDSRFMSVVLTGAMKKGGWNGSCAMSGLFSTAVTLRISRI